MKLTELYLDFLKELDSQELTPENIREKTKEICEKHNETLKNDGTDSYKYFLLETENIHITKSVSRGFSPMMSGTKKNDKGEDVEHIWPDFNEYDSESYDYFLYRFQNTENKYLKANYGLTAYIGGSLKHIKDKQLLVKTLYEVARELLKLINSAKHSFKFKNLISDFLRDAFELAVNSKMMSKVEDIITFIRAEFDSLSPSDKEYYTFFYLLSDLYLDHKKEIDRYLNIKEFIDKINSDLQSLRQKEDTSAALILARIGLSVVQKYEKIPNQLWQKLIGELLEQIGDNEIKRGNKFGSTNYLEAGEFYIRAGEKELEKKVITKYEAKRGQIEFGLFTSQLSESETDSLDNWIDNLIDKKDPGLIISLWMLRTNITRISDIRTSIDKSKRTFLDEISAHTVNKFGDTAERYETKEQKREHKFWEQFTFSFQFSSKIAFSATIKAIKKDVISAEHVIGFLKNTWLNEPINRVYQGQAVSIIPNDTIIPAVGHFFYVFKELVKGNDKIINHDFVTPIDSLVLKFETILRFASEKAGLNTTIIGKSSNGFSVPKYKLLGQLFRELNEEGYFDEMDSTIFKFLFIIPEQANYRNDIAHGTFDLHQYEPRKGLIILGAIVRLAMLDFKKKKL